MKSNVYDFIVVGAGAAGGALAARLSECGKYTVLCLEAGRAGHHYIWSRPPTGSAFMFENAAVNWCYHSEPNPTHGNRPLYVPRGKMLGGSTSLNGMVYNRGQPLDYDTWARLGCPGWTYRDVLPFFKKLESTDVGSDDYRGRTGPIKVTVAPKLSAFYDLFLKSAEAIGIRYNDDYSGEVQEGVAMAQQTIYRGLRVSTATHYLKDASKRKNLTIARGAEATSLIMDGKRCVGIRFVQAGLAQEARASREVIVSCGTANSPKLLELSGIGNPDLLNKHGVKVVHELRGVGENLRDHFAAATKWRFNRPNLSLASRGRGFGLIREIVRFALFRTGFVALVFGSIRVFTRSRSELDSPDIMLLAVPFIVEMKPGKLRKVLPIEGFYLNGHVQRPESTGSIHIRSSDPFAAPRIDFRFLDTETDRQAAIAAVRRMRELALAAPLGAFIAEELAPGPHVQTDEEILKFIRENGQITHHMVGTCKMGNDPMAVVDESLRVHGISGLRVADASIMPTMPSGNTVIPTIMIGEKCAATVLADAAKNAPVENNVRQRAPMAISL
ncbi:GMC family oxidoreductase [Caballeronia novacaledonica]|uniref:GMC family oxidoreductase N-terminal domain-containing protein n=1 Tax=Caballeronia novacaledonica TaxID=1544861 RepID=A0AA37MV39_9BURK|nr:GMC family oxidoreductase N-terminal domain-containing protein [Caballeronia novacaledonica]GJH30059.1 GMC family oxidoreductase N-terminal domain-containing protein [Caballeronia novacaledonica]